MDEKIQGADMPEVAGADVPAAADAAGDTAVAPAAPVAAAADAAAGADAPAEKPAEQPTALMPGGGKPAEVHDDAAPVAGTLPMPKPGPRPDDPTHELHPSEPTLPNEAATAVRDVAALPAPTDDAPDGEHSSARPRLRLRIALIAAAVVVIVVVAALTYTAEFWGGRTIPNVAGLTEPNAQDKLESLGFSVETRDTPTDAGVGTVLGTDPEPNVRAAKGSTVTLHVGVPRVVPDIVGKQVSDAKAALADAGITSIVISYVNSDKPEGSVISVSAAKGTVVTADEQITLQVAQPFTVPDVTGLSQDEATKAIAEAGLVSKIQWQEAEGAALTTLSTSPAAGTRVKSGDTVTVTVVAPGARNETYLPDYLSSSPRDISSYLSWKGWSFRYGETTKGAGTLAGTDCAETGWSKAGVGTLIITPKPQSSKHGSFLGEFLTHDVLADGAAIAGVRFEAERSGDAANPTVDSATVNTWATRCGLTGLQGTLSGDEVARAMDTGGRSTPDMLVGYGEEGDVVWSVAVVKGQGVVVTCAPKGLYDDVDLGAYGNSLGVYLAYCAGYGA